MSSKFVKSIEGYSFYSQPTYGINIMIKHVDNTVVEFDDMSLAQSSAMIHAFMNDASVEEIWVQDKNQTYWYFD